MENEALLGAQRGYEEKYKSRGPELMEKGPSSQVVGFVERYRDRIGKKILDLGSGFGNNLEFLARQGFQATGIELSPKGAGITKERIEKENLSASVVVGDIEHLPFAKKDSEEVFDSAISRRVIDYSDTESVFNKMKELSRVLRKDGLFFMSVRSASQKSKENEQLIEENQWGGKTFRVTSGAETGANQHYFTKAEIENLSQQTGFQIEEIGENSYVGAKDEQKKFEWLVVLRKVK